MYTNIFADIPNRSDLSKYESHFEAITNESYKEFLIDKYTKNNLNKIDIANLLGTTEGVITTHLRNYNIGKPQSQNTNSSNDIYTKTPSQVEREMGRPFIEIYEELAAQGYSLTEITAKLQIRRVSTVSSYLFKHKQKQNEKPVDPSNFVIQGLSGRSPETIEKMFREQLGIEYKDWLYQKYMIDGLSLNEIYHITGIKEGSLSARMKAYNFKKTMSQIKKEQIKRGTINYDDIGRKGRKSRSKSISRSNKQDLIRELLKHHINERLSKDNSYSHLEIITGYSEWSILNNLEIDIPIIVFDGDKVFKIALEYNGDFWHVTNKHDENKKELLANNNWIMYEIEETNKDSNNLGFLEIQAKNIVDNIFNLIHNETIN